MRRIISDIKNCIAAVLPEKKAFILSGSPLRELLKYFVPDQLIGFGESQVSFITDQQQYTLLNSSELESGKSILIPSEVKYESLSFIIPSHFTLTFDLKYPIRALVVAKMINNFHQIVGRGGTYYIVPRGSLVIENFDRYIGAMHHLANAEISTTDNATAVSFSDGATFIFTANPPEGVSVHHLVENNKIVNIEGDVVKLQHHAVNHNLFANIGYDR